MYKRFAQFWFLLFVLVLDVYPKQHEPKHANTCSLSDEAQAQFDFFFYEAINQKNNRNADAALETFEFCLSLDSLDAATHFELGKLYLYINLNNKAQYHIEKAVSLQPDNWWYNEQLISFFSNTKNWKKAIEVTLHSKTYFPNKENVYSILAALYRETNDFTKAIVAYDNLEALNGVDESVSIEKSRLYLMSNKSNKAIAEIDKLIKKFPNDTRYQVLKGDFYLQQKSNNKAFDIYQKVLKDDAQNADAYVSLSAYYNATNQPEKAIESIVCALKNEQLDADTKMDVLGQYVERFMQDSTKFKQTESLFKMMVDNYPLEEKVHGYYAVFLQLLRRNNEAISELETMLNINAKNEKTWMNLIQLYLTEKRPAELLQVSDRAIQVFPTNALWFFYRGMASYQLGNYKEAMSTFSAGIALVTPQQAMLKSDLYAQLADAYYKLDDKKSSFEAYEQSIVINPKNIMVMNNYAYYLSLEKLELKKAEKMSAKTVELEPKNSTYLDTYAWILYQQGNYSLAKFYIERAVENLQKKEDPSVVLEHYGDILWMHGKNDSKQESKALEMWVKAMDNGNKSPELKQKVENKGWTR